MLLVLDFATTGKGGVDPFVGFCVIVGAFGVVDAHVQGGMVSLMYLLPVVSSESFRSCASDLSSTISNARDRTIEASEFKP
ncbi:hypothetical protein LINPERHAP2_LOCUS13694 [Linum perenne]